MGDEILLVYDKQCPACDYYCNLVRVRESAGRLILVDARDGGSIMDDITAAGLDVDRSMVVKVGGTLYCGSDAIHVLALMGSNSGLFNRFTHLSFKYRPVAKVLYPVLRTCRNLLLKSLGKTKINNLAIPGNDQFRGFAIYPCVGAVREIWRMARRSHAERLWARVALVRPRTILSTPTFCSTVAH